MTDQYAVFGNPIAHSKSPRIHALFAEQTHQDINYTKQLVELGHFAEAAKKFFDEGGKGLNVTVPFKLDAYEFAKQHGSVNEPASLAGAVNTLKIMNGKVFGYNTDGIGLIRDLRNKCFTGLPGLPQFSLINKSVLIIGAGGAVSGILPGIAGLDETIGIILSEIVREGFGEIVIANRTKATASELANKFNKLQSQIKITYCGIEEIEKRPFGVIINGTSASLAGEELDLPKEIIKSTTLCYDMMYGKEDTKFMKWVKKQGSEYVFNGLGMLVEQAAESFCLWRNVKYEQLDTKAVIEKIRSEL